MTIIAQPAFPSIALTPDKRVSMFFIDMRVIYRHDTTQITLLKVVNNNVVRRLRVQTSEVFETSEVLLRLNLKETL